MKYISCRLSEPDVYAVGKSLSHYSSFLRSSLSVLHELRIKLEEVGAEDWKIDSVIRDIEYTEYILTNVSSLCDRCSDWECEVSHE